VQAVPVAHAIAGHADAPTVWQVNPFWVQSESCVHVTLWAWARAVLEAPRAPSAKSEAMETRANRGDIMVEAPWAARRVCVDPVTP
jgi:hypothetical protein